QQFPGTAMPFRSHLLPPTPNRPGGEPGGVMVDPHADPTLILRDIIHAVGDRFPQGLVEEVVHDDFRRLSLRLPFSPAVLEVPDHVLFVSVTLHVRRAGMRKPVSRSIVLIAMRIPVGFTRALLAFPIILQAVPRRSQQPSNSTGPHWMPLPCELPSQLC